MTLIEEASEELKRADHLLYVSLKYTRTVDVIKSIIDRLISGISLAIDALLERAKERKKVKEIPSNAGLKAELVKKLFNDEKITDMVIFYQTLKKISRAEYRRSNEYRRHVTMTAITDSGILLITMETIREYYDRTVGYVAYADSLLNPRKE
ncbi:hypothetical protein HYY74_07670 [Candidatus Woesearchaeota archaeon]|nr:hypothetical protein [Candidatus Woesearchaeota archaeon]